MARRALNRYNSGIRSACHAEQNLLPITAKGMVIAMAMVGLGPNICAQPVKPERVHERTDVSNLALLSQSHPRRLPDSHHPFRKGETLRLVYSLRQPAEDVEPYG